MNVRACVGRGVPRLTLLRECREEGEVCPLLHEVVDEQHEQQRVRHAPRIPRGDAQVARGRHRRELGASLAQELLGSLHPLDAAPEHTPRLRLLVAQALRKRSTQPVRHGCVWDQLPHLMAESLDSARRLQPFPCSTAAGRSSHLRSRVVGRDGGGCAAATRGRVDAALLGQHGLAMGLALAVRLHLDRDRDGLARLTSRLHLRLVGGAVALSLLQLRHRPHPLERVVEEGDGARHRVRLHDLGRQDHLLGDRMRGEVPERRVDRAEGGGGVQPLSNDVRLEQACPAGARVGHKVGEPLPAVRWRGVARPAVLERDVRGAGDAVEHVGQALEVCLRAVRLNLVDDGRRAARHRRARRALLVTDELEDPARRVRRRARDERPRGSRELGGGELVQAVVRLDEAEQAELAFSPAVAEEDHHADGRQRGTQLQRDHGLEEGHGARVAHVVPDGREVDVVRLAAVEGLAVHDWHRQKQRLAAGEDKDDRHRQKVVGRAPPRGGLCSDRL
mmetsp:Transcript_7089/g.21297  ORF Transcript_7089/g.21297 Transcript_7089/m.21297 type:complete len:505 (+) Transcript_7089:406-1920(+)